MARRIFVRLGVALPAIWLILTMVFMLVHIVPGDPVQQMLGEDARAEDLNNLRHVLGLDQPLYTQYWDMLKRMLWDRDLVSYTSGQNVLTQIVQGIPATFSLTIGAGIIWLP